VGPGFGLDALEKLKFSTLPGLELLPLGRPASSQSLYRLSYPVSLYSISSSTNISATLLQGVC
jgi:hypothetical protein